MVGKAIEHARREQPLSRRFRLLEGLELDLDEDLVRILKAAENPMSLRRFLPPGRVCIEAVSLPRLVIVDLKTAKQVCRSTPLALGGSGRATADPNVPSSP